MKNWLKQLFSDSGTVSSKRVFGAIGFVSSIVFIAIWEHSLINELMLTGATLLGLGILDRFKNNKNTPQP